MRGNLPGFSMRFAFDWTYALCIHRGMIKGTDIIAIRQKLGLTQSELGDRLGGLHQGTVSRLERGQTKPRGLVLKVLLDLQAEAAARSPKGEAA